MLVTLPLTLVSIPRKLTLQYIIKGGATGVSSHSRRINSNLPNFGKLLGKCNTVKSLLLTADRYSNLYKRVRNLPPHDPAETVN